MADLSVRLEMEPELYDRMHMRARLLASIRRFFDKDDYLEVTTPCLTLAPDPAPHLQSFTTSLIGDRARAQLFLPTSPEHHMKRMLSAGFERIYQIGPFFRNGEMGTLHNPEFTGLEWYQTGLSVEGLMDQTEKMLREVALNVVGQSCLSRCGIQVDLRNDFKRMSIKQALEELALVDVPADWDEVGLRKALLGSGLDPGENDSFDDLVNRALVARVEPALESMGPVFLFDYPAEMAAMARLRPFDAHVSERFELYAGGMELCNGYGELNDEDEQRRRFALQVKARKQKDQPSVPLDEAFLQAVGQMPKASGNALGIDRLMMLLCGVERIEQVLAFPLTLELE
jgi:lysyl-tRNA synthetase class 2